MKAQVDVIRGRFLEEDKTETDSEIKISYEFLKESSDIFENWKVN